MLETPSRERDKLNEKQRLREKIWKLLEDEGVARFPLPIRGRIPNFEGSDKAAERLIELEEWKGAKVVVANPDSPQKKARELVLREGKTLIMASPKLKHGYLRIEPGEVRGKEGYASTIKGAFRFGKRADELPKIDLIITGCVAASEDGRRLGKGGGYGDREIAVIKGKFGDVPVVTTVHELQLAKNIPWEEHDQKVDVIVTPTRIIRVVP